jgi:hypothetical protein
MGLGGKAKLKKAFVPMIVGLFLAFASAQAQAPSFTSSVPPNPSILRVLAAREAALAGNELAPVGGRREFKVRGYGLAVQQINADDCPGDFNQAWYRYRHAWLVRARYFADKELRVESDLAWKDLKKQCVIFNTPLPPSTPSF